MVEKKLKILHAPWNIGGQAWGISRGERKLGYQSDCVVFNSSWINYPCDYNLNLKKRNSFKSLFKILIFFLSALKKYDIFHFYFGDTFLPLYLDLPILRVLKKKIFFTFQGCDIRRGRYCITNFKTSACKECQVLVCRRRYRDTFKFLKTKIINFFAHKTFVLNPDLLFFSPSSEILPYVNIDLNEWKPVQISKKNKLITILHAPTNRTIKGTAYIIEVISKLKKEGFPIELKLIEGIPHSRVKSLYLEADIGIDQVLSGWYGVFSVEMMALGKPVICYLNKDLFRFVPWAKDIPIINATPRDLYAKLKWLIENPSVRLELGRKSREFVENYHDPIKVAKKLIQYYEQ